MWLLKKNIYCCKKCKDIIKSQFIGKMKYVIIEPNWKENQNYHNLSLGLATMVKAYKGAGQEWAWESHFMLMGVQKSVREWTPTFPNELPLWELESQWIPKSSEGNCRGPNSLDWIFFYIIENILERRCLRWARMTH
jgi:hypothetical protein